MVINASAINSSAINGASGVVGEGSVIQTATCLGHCGGYGAVVQVAVTSANGIVVVGNNGDVTQFSSIYGYCGGYGVLLQSDSIAGTAVTTIIGYGEVTQSASINGVGVVSGVATSTVVQACSVYGYCGGYGGATQPVASVTGAGITSGVGEATVIQLSSYLGTGVVGIAGFGAVLQASAIGSNGHATVVQQSTASGVSYAVGNNLYAYAMNIKTAEMSVYTNYAFQYVMRIGTNYYGVKSDGLYLLEGASDNGTAIDSRFRTAETDFGSSYVKRMPYVYMDSDTATKIKPLADGEGTQSYDSAFAGRRTHLSRGLSGRFWAVEVSNKSGVPMKVGSLELFAENLSRKV